MESSETNLVPPVDPLRLEMAYKKCAHMITESRPDGAVDAARITNTLSEEVDLPSKAEADDLFLRLCLVVQLVAKIDALWADSGLSGGRPETLPFAFFELVSGERAFEDSGGTYSSVYFARNVDTDAVATLIPN